MDCVGQSWTMGVRFTPQQVKANLMHLTLSAIWDYVFVLGHFELLFESLYVVTHQLPLDLRREEFGLRYLMRIKYNPDYPSNKVICQVDASKFGPRFSTPFQIRLDKSVSDLPLKTESILEVIPSRVPPWLISKAKLYQKAYCKENHF